MHHSLSVLAAAIVLVQSAPAPGDLVRISRYSQLGIISDKTVSIKTKTATKMYLLRETSRDQSQ